MSFYVILCSSWWEREGESWCGCVRTCAVYQEKNVSAYNNWICPGVCVWVNKMLCMYVCVSVCSSGWAHVLEMRLHNLWDSYQAFYLLQQGVLSNRWHSCTFVDTLTHVLLLDVQILQVLWILGNILLLLGVQNAGGNRKSLLDMVSCLFCLSCTLP